MESLLKTELVNIILFSTYLDGSIPLDDECIQLRTSCHSTFKKTHNSKKNKKKANSVASIYWLKQVKHIMVKGNTIDIFLPTNEKQFIDVLCMDGYCRTFCFISATAVQQLAYL
jgi:hypothetical protein